MTRLDELTVSILEEIGNLADEVLDEEEKKSYLYDGGAGAEIWEFLTFKKDFTDEEVMKAMDELLDNDLMREKEVEEVENRLIGMPVKSSVWYREKNTKYVFSEDLQRYLEE